MFPVIVMSVCNVKLSQLELVSALVETQEKVVFSGERPLDAALQVRCIGLDLLKEFVCEKGVGYIGDIVRVQKPKVSVSGS